MKQREKTEPVEPSAGGLVPELAALRRFVLFADLEDAELDRIRARMRVRVAQAGHEIVSQQGDDSKDVYFLFSGRARVSLLSPNGGLVRLAELRAGEIFGDLAAIDGTARSASVDVVSTCRYGIMSRDAFLTTVTHSPPLALKMLQSVAARIRLQNERYLEKSAFTLSGRLARELLRRADRRENANIVVERFSPSEVAKVIGARRESVSREISRLTRGGILERKSDLLIIRDARALTEAADIDAEFP